MKKRKCSFSLLPRRDHFCASVSRSVDRPPVLTCEGVKTNDDVGRTTRAYSREGCGADATRERDS